MTLPGAAEGALLDPAAITIDDRTEDERLAPTGLDVLGRVVVVV